MEGSPLRTQGRNSDGLEFDPSRKNDPSAAAMAAAAAVIGSSHRGPQTYIDSAESNTHDSHDRQDNENNSGNSTTNTNSTKIKSNGKNRVGTRSASDSHALHHQHHQHHQHQQHQHQHQQQQRHASHSHMHPIATQQVPVTASQYGDMPFGLDMLGSVEGQDGYLRQQMVYQNVQGVPNMQAVSNVQNVQNLQNVQPVQNVQAVHSVQNVPVRPQQMGMQAQSQPQPQPQPVPMSMPATPVGGGRKRKVANQNIQAQQPPPPGSATSIDDNESSLKHEAQANATLDISMLANKVRSEESGPSAEKNKQIFGMTWLYKNCEQAADENVPRNRIYARYVTLCTELNLKPLNPASFGKLVRLIFPGIKTRRLGIRGQSKYHYCGVKLIGDQNNPTGSTPVGTPGRYGNSPDSVSLGMSGGNYSRNSGGEPSSANTSGYINSPFSTPSQVRGGSGTSRSTPTSEDHGPAKNGTSVAFSAPQQLQTLTGFDALFSDASNISLSSHSHELGTIPHLEDFFDSSADPDSASTLYGLYKTHCRSLIEALRFMHVKKFLNLQSSFIGLLTAPVQKQLKEDGVIEWTRRVDWITYKEMVQLLSPLVLQDVPPEVLQGLRSLCHYLPSALSSSLKNQAPKYVEARMSQARAFVSLVDRLLRTNEAGQNAGRILILDSELRQMRSDWTQFVNARKLIEREVPCGGEQAIQILEKEVLRLLSPEEFGDVFDPELLDFRHSEPRPKPEPGAPHDESNPAGNGLDHGDVGDLDHPPSSSSKLEEVIVKWARYLSALPSRFPHVPPRLFLMAFTSVVTGALREITFNGAISFGAWWVVQCWMGEWMHWTAELGGFLNHPLPSGGPSSDNLASEGADAPAEPQSLDSFLNGTDGKLNLAFPTRGFVHHKSNSVHKPDQALVDDSLDLRDDNNLGEDFMQS